MQNTNIVKSSDKIAVWFSCGAASAVALKLTVDKYGLDNVYAVNNPVIEVGYNVVKPLTVKS